MSIWSVKKKEEEKKPSSFALLARGTPTLPNMGTQTTTPQLGPTREATFAAQNVNVKPVTREDVQKTIPATFEFLSKNIGQPTMQAYAGIGGWLSGKTLTPETQFQKDLYGTDKPITLASAGASNFGVSEKSIFAPALGVIAGAGDLIPGGGSRKIFTGFPDLSTKLLEKLKGRTTVSRQFIEDLSNSPDLKQAERDLIRRVLGEEKFDTSLTFKNLQADDYNTKIFGKDYDEPVKFYRGGDLKPDKNGNLWFTPEDWEALKYSEGFNGPTESRVSEALIASKKPFLLEGSDMGAFSKEIQSNWNKLGLKQSDWDINDPKVKQKAIDYAKENGYDSVYFADSSIDGQTPMRSLVIFDEALVRYKKIGNKVERTGKEQMFSDQISVPDFANKVKSELLPLNVDSPMRGPKYESINLSDEVRGPVADYHEKIYRSPIKTSAGNVHFGNDYPDYFAHTRIEDIPDIALGKQFRTEDGTIVEAMNKSENFRAIPGARKGVSGIQVRYPDGSVSTIDAKYLTPVEGSKTRRVIEIQSDLFQKGRLENEAIPRLTGTENLADINVANATRQADVAKLEPYRNTWHERVIREEIKQAAKDGKTKLQFPTGETAMKIEGLGQGGRDWFERPIGNTGRAYNGAKLTTENLKVGKQVSDGGSDWIITDVLGDGKFKAVPKDKVTRENTLNGLEDFKETFDISGKVDTNNPIYKFYEKEVGRYLSNKYGATRIKDPQGVEWYEIDLKKGDYGGQPVEAFGLGAGIQQDEEGNVEFDPESALMGAVGIGALRAFRGKGPGKVPSEGGSQLAGQAQKSLQQAGGVPGKSVSDVSSLAKDTTKLATNASLNVENLNISKSGKKVVEQVVEEIKPQIEKKIGNVLSNKEALKLADQTSEVLQKAIGRESTLEWESAMLKARQELAASAKTGTVDKEFIENLLVVKTQGTDIARKLQSLSIGADPKLVTNKQLILDSVLEVTNNVDEVLNAAKGVDFNDYRQAAEFYRQFVKPKASEWIDLLRYNSMLSSPLTHIINAFSNAINSGLVAPVEKAILGGLDFLGTAVTGKERKYFAGESAMHAAGYFTNIREASKRFWQALTGARASTNLDTRDIPIATKGVKGAVVKVLGFPMRMLEASDQFFTALTEAGETASLTYKQAKGAKVGNIPSLAEDKAAYRLFRQELFPEGQGTVLDAVDHFTKLVYTMRNADNPIVSNVAKFTVPFIRTPMNILKQGIEYSPAGYFTLIGNAHKTEQVAKAVIGTAVFGTAATLLASNRLTWSEPTNEVERNAFRNAGKQPYSVKVGDTWYSYQKLPPGLAFPFSMVALIDEQSKQGKIDQSTAEMVLASIAKYGDFLADQSYAKSIGDLLSALQGGESDWARVMGNIPQQLVPFRALGGWLARLTDDVQRKPDPEGNFIEKQVQLLMMNIPGLSQKVPARTNSVGKEIESRQNEINAVSPVRITTEDPEASAEFDNIMQIRQMEREASAQHSVLKDQAEETWREISQLPREEMVARLKELKKANEPLHDKVVDIGEAEKLGLNPEEKQLKSASTDTRAKFLLEKIKGLSPEEKKTLLDSYKEKKILTPSVLKRMKELKQQ